MKTEAVITIGRQFGSGGRDIGKLVSELLEIPFYDSKLILEAAKKSGLSSEVLAEKDEKLPGTFLHALSFGFGFPSAFTQESLFNIQSDAIKDIASAGPCVIVGRCADYILRNNPACRNIFIHSPKDIRVKTIIDRRGVSEKEAAEIIDKTDKERAAYYDFYTDKHWGDSKSYHLSIDSSLLGKEKTAEYICSFIKASVG